MARLWAAAVWTVRFIRAGGPAIKAACAELRRTQYPRGLPTGEAVITTAGKLPARYVIHTVGPVYGSGGADKADLLAACYFNSMSLATLHKLNTIAFPAISTGYLRLSSGRGRSGVVAYDRAVFGG
jgi:O-acetyl-ADP-ribose deacetylase (regulator of RNase III)